MSTTSSGKMLHTQYTVSLQRPNTKILSYAHSDSPGVVAWIIIFNGAGCTVDFMVFVPRRKLTAASVDAMIA